MCSRCGKKGYCSPDCQRRAWKLHKLVCQKADTPENEVDDLLAKGLLFSAQEAVKRLPKPNQRLATDLEERITAGVFSEVIAGCVRLEAIEGFGRGYVASQDIAQSQPILFDTAFCSAPLDGDKEYHFIIAEKAIRKGTRDRRASTRAASQVDFYHECLKQLGTKDGMDKKWLEDTPGLDQDMVEQVLLCSIAECNCMLCSEEPTLVALFPAAARFNHSCAPNAVVESNRHTALVRARCAIPAGTEVTISYLPEILLADATSRRERLQNGRGFACRCAQCRQDGFSADAAKS